MQIHHWNVNCLKSPEAHVLGASGSCARSLKLWLSGREMMWIGVVRYSELSPRSLPSPCLPALIRKAEDSQTGNCWCTQRWVLDIQPNCSVVAGVVVEKDWHSNIKNEGMHSVFVIFLQRRTGSRGKMRVGSDDVLFWTTGLWHQESLLWSGPSSKGRKGEERTEKGEERTETTCVWWIRVHYKSSRCLFFCLLFKLCSKAGILLFSLFYLLQ